MCTKKGSGAGAARTSEPGGAPAPRLRPRRARLVFLHGCARELEGVATALAYDGPGLLGKIRILGVELAPAPAAPVVLLRKRREKRMGGPDDIARA